MTCDNAAIGSAAGGTVAGPAACWLSSWGQQIYIDGFGGEGGALVGLFIRVIGVVRLCQPVSDSCVNVARSRWAGIQSIIWFRFWKPGIGGINREYFSYNFIHWTFFMKLFLPPVPIA